MKIRFNGVRTPGKSTGCPVCGGRRKVNHNFNRTISITFPSGQTRKFTMGIINEVSDTEGEYLKQWSYRYGGMEYFPFVEV